MRRPMIHNAERITKIEEGWVVGVGEGVVGIAVGGMVVTWVVGGGFVGVTSTSVNATSSTLSM